MEGMISVFEQMERLLVRLGPRRYTQPVPLIGNATLGQHVRHILDAYACLARGTERGVVDYSRRERPKAWEEDPREALAALRALRKELASADREKPLWVVADDAGAGAAKEVRFRSSLGRELHWTRDHAIHHLAILRIVLEHAFPDLEVEEDLGVAPSTLAYRRGGAATSS